MATSQTFAAAPQVVRGKDKFKSTNMYDIEEEDERNTLNIMHDKRVFRGNTHNMNVLKGAPTPAQKEEQRIQIEREKKKVEMIKQQLIEFKKSKNKTSPYDLRPGPPARIDVDLTYFLTEQGKNKPDVNDERTQTDVFLPKPPTPKYIPKKTGIDKDTQIGDYDLFDYDTEVQPILNVLLTKTVEQALLEVEEETELDNIRKFKEQYHKRQQQQHDQWEQEVKKEVARIKHKNKALYTARMKREQQVKTMHKLQCLNFAKNLLKNSRVNTLSHLVENSYWRNSFEDQLSEVYGNTLINNVQSELQQDSQVQNFLNEVVKDQLANISQAKDPIKRAIKLVTEKREKIRMIESDNRRLVHFLFKPNVPATISPFARKYIKMLDGTLDEFEQEEHEKFDGYIERFGNEETEGEADVNPVVYEKNPFTEFELSTMQRIAFSVADDPFLKNEVAKYYPHIYVFNEGGDVISEVSAHNRRDAKHGIEYVEDFRDAKVRINDDRKIKITLPEIKDSNAMILLTVRTFDLRKETVAPGQYDKAWFRLQNEDTNQTLDYANINKIELPEGFTEEGADDEGAEEEDAADASKPRNELVYIAGRIYKCDGKWIFEQYHHVTTSEQFPDIAGSMGDLFRRAKREVTMYDERLTAAKEKIVRAQEERRLAQLAAQAKKKTQGKGRKGKKDEQVEEEEPKQEESKVQESERELDLFIPSQFAQAISEKIPRPYMFGPVEFTNLNCSDDDFDSLEQRQKVIDILEQTSILGDIGICVHGYRVLVKNRTLKRRMSILKHARFLNNLVVQPVFPPEPEPVKDENQENENEEENGDDE